MKKIILKKITPHNGCYLVKLGNGYEYLFAQLKQAERFLSQTSKFLTGQLVILNDVYLRSFDCYRRNFLLFRPDSGKRQSQILQAERDINVYLKGVNESLEKAHWMATSDNGNFVVFASFYYCIAALRSICQNINLIADRQKLTTLKYELVALHQQINIIERTLNEYEQLRALRMVERARFDDISYTELSKVVG